MDQVPATLNPRAAADAAGQRIGALIFRALTRIDEDLEPRPDLSDRWEAGPRGLSWRFHVPSGAAAHRDHAGAPITAALMARCLEQYRAGHPLSIHLAAFPAWRATRAEGEWVAVELSRPDPYLPRNFTLLRYFRQEGAPEPCAEPDPRRALIGSGRLRPDPWDLSPDQELKLVPTGPGARATRIRFVRDETTRALQLLRGNADVAQNALSLTKTRWIARAHADRFHLLEREGVAVSYLAFNLRDPLLGRREVRRAIAHAIDRAAIIRHKMMGFGSLADSFLSPRLPESIGPAPATALAYDPAESARLLEAAGFPRGPDGVRLRLRYRTTPAREGFETGLMLREMLGRVGIAITLDVVEPAVFQASLRKGGFQLFSSRWVGVADASILDRSLRTGNPGNRVGYSSPEVDRLLDRMTAATDPNRRLPLARAVQAAMLRDLPYFPLWHWHNGLVVRNELRDEFSGRKLSLSGALDPLVFR